MMQRWDMRLKRWDRWWLLILSSGLFLVFMVIVLPVQAQQAAEYASDSQSPDTSFLLGPSELYDIAAAYGPTGRRQYIQARWTFDVIFPLVYGLFFFSAINSTLRRVWPNRPWLSRLALLAPAAIAADLLENSALSGLMALYPRQIAGLAILATALSTLKWLLVSLAMVVALGGLAAFALVWLKRRFAF